MKVQTRVILTQMKMLLYKHNIQISFVGMHMHEILMTCGHEVAIANYIAS